MKIYEAHYELHSGMEPKHALKNKCEYSHIKGSVEIFGENYSFRGTKEYALDTESDEVTEVFTAHPFYILSSVALFACAGIVLLNGFGTDLISLFGDIFGMILPFSAIYIAFTPNLMISQRPDGFRAANYPENELPDLQPAVFRNRVSFTKMVYLNYFAAGIISHAGIFSGLHILSPVYALGMGGVILLNMNGHDPATDKTVFLSILALLPYGATMLNLLIYSQWEKMISDMSGILLKYMQFANEMIDEIIFLSVSELDPEQSRVIVHMGQIWMASDRFARGLLTEIAQAPLIGLIVMNVVILYTLIQLKRSLDSPSDPFGMYRNPPTVTDKKYLRAGVSLVLAVYIVFSLTIFGSLLIRSPLIPIDTVIGGLLIFWPVCIITPLYIAVWYQQRNNRTTVDNINAEPHQFEFDGIPVVVKNTSDREGLAFVRSDGENELIVIDSQLHDELSDDEIEAICYHELYHITHDSMRYQTRIETPIIGYLLFFLSTNLERLYNDEYRADVFAAQQSDTKTLLSALRKANSLKEIINKSKLKTKIDQGWWGYAELFCSPPVLKLYSPPAEDRIARLEAIKNQEA